jgi:hypothetical protein
VVVQHYIRGLHWVLQYYYRGVASWDWFYPYHYAPMAQDMRQLSNIDGETACWTQANSADVCTSAARLARSVPGLQLALCAECTTC